MLPYPSGCAFVDLGRPGSLHHFNCCRSSLAAFFYVCDVKTDPAGNEDKIIKIYHTKEKLPYQSVDSFSNMEVMIGVKKKYNIQFLS